MGTKRMTGRRFWIKGYYVSAVGAFSLDFWNSCYSNMVIGFLGLVRENVFRSLCLSVQNRGIL